MVTPEKRLMEVLVNGGIVLKDATTTYSELLSAVAQLTKAQDCPIGYDKSHCLNCAFNKAQLAKDVCPECAFCGSEMSKNPHPDAGKPDKFLEVGTVNICIPCLVLNRHRWAERAMKAEGELEATCQGKAQPDREKIAECLTELFGKYKDMSWRADQIIAIFPDEEKIRKQERERTIALLKRWHDTGTHLISAETIEALEEGKK